MQDMICAYHPHLSPPFLCAHDSESGSDLHLLYNLPPLLPQPLSTVLWRENPFWKCSSSLLLVVSCCPQSSQSHLRHILSRGSICSWGCSSSCCNHTKNHKEKQLEFFTQPLQFPGLPLQQLHYKGNHSPSAMLTPPDTRTSRLTSGLHSTGGKKTILPPLLLLLRLLFYQHAPAHTDSSPESSVPQAPVCGHSLDLLLQRMKGRRNQRTRWVVRLLPCHQHFLSMK